ncbi:MAG: hypothetical protein KAR05_08200 [Candidatus Omnitrophica bacterium]|nr:hypothetical protein [Candidatus Omnitrophota bacterium]
MKKIVSFTAFLALVLCPLSTVYAQESIEQQFIEVAQGLDLEEQAEFIELLRDPSDLGIAVDDLGIPENFSNRLREILPARVEDGEGKLNRLTKKIDTIANKIEHKLANVKEHQAGKADKILEKSIKKTSKLVEKAEKKDDKDKDKDKVPEPDVETPPAEDPPKDKKEK